MSTPPIMATDTWRSWGKKIAVFLDDQESKTIHENTPRPVLFSHAIGGDSITGLERATVDGIMMYDPSQDMLMLSVNGEWQYIFDAATTASLFSVAAYGGMLMSAPTAGTIPGTGVWTKLTQFDAATVTEKAIDFNTTNDTFSFPYEGVYRLSIGFTLEHNSLNAGRRFSFRLFNETDAVGATGTVIGVARNVEVTNYSISLLLEIAVADVDDVFSLEVGDSPDTFSALIWETLRIDANMVSEWRGGNTTATGFLAFKRLFQNNVVRRP